MLHVLSVVDQLSGGQLTCAVQHAIMVLYCSRGGNVTACSAIHCASRCQQLSAVHVAYAQRC